MTFCKDIVSFLEKAAPPELAEDWDNIGLLVGRSANTVKRILVCLDITHAAIDEALRTGADMIVTHHPVIFKGVKRLDEDDKTAGLIYLLIRNNICVYSAHTNLDFAEQGVNTCLADSLGLKQTVVLGRGPGKVGILEKECSMEEFIKKVKKSLSVPYVRVAGKVDSGIRRAAVFSGSFDGDLEAVKASGADVLVTGDLKYHTALDAREMGMCVIDAGHFNTEKIVLPVLASMLQDSFGDIDVICFGDETDPLITT